MPLKAKPSTQLITLTDAKAVAANLASLGIPVTDIREISNDSGEVNINHPDYVDDNLIHQFVANVWGKDQELGLVKAMLAETNKFYALLKIANDSFPTQEKSYAAIVNLPPLNAAIEAVLVRTFI